VRTVLVDKIASVAQHNRLGQELRLAADIPCEEGVLVAARVLNNKSRYNLLELTSGRMAKINQGDIVVGALGHRDALHGYAGHLPSSLGIGSHVQILNVGGVMGICDSANPEVGAPFDCEVLGAVLEFPYLGERIGVPARAGAARLALEGTCDVAGIPVVALAGTCMDSGKTAAACSIIGRLRHLGYQVAAGKATGVSLRRDILAMEDAGARETMLFSDFGVVATTSANGPALTRALLSTLARSRPDVIVLELGDGLLGSYGVDAILSDAAITDALAGIVLCANDPVAAWGGNRILHERYGLIPIAISGPATDNSVGTGQITKLTKLPAINALTDGAALGDVIVKIVAQAAPEQRAL
jgi:hypothetical protein